MHEAAVCAEIMTKVGRIAHENNLAHVTRIEIVTGPGSCLREQDLNFYFHISQEGTCMEGAWIDVTQDPAVIDASQMLIRSIEGN